MKISEKIKELRKAKGWSQGQLAKKINSLPQHISRYERGIVTPSAETLAKIANAFGISADYLLNEKQEKLTDYEMVDRELLRYFKEASKLSEEDKMVIKKIIESMIAKNQRNN